LLDNLLFQQYDISGFHYCDRLKSLGAVSFLLAVLAAFFVLQFLLRPLLASSLSLYWDTDVTIGRAVIHWSQPEIILEEVNVGNPTAFPAAICWKLSGR